VKHDAIDIVLGAVLLATLVCLIAATAGTTWIFFNAIVEGL